MKGNLEFDLENFEDQLNMKRCLKSLDLVLALRSIGSEIFRPARKHGYSDSELAELDSKTIEVIGLLESKFYDILKQYNIDIDELG